jgi:hypothetical protein
MRSFDALALGFAVTSMFASLLLLLAGHFAA